MFALVMKLLLHGDAGRACNSLSDPAVARLQVALQVRFHLGHTADSISLSPETTMALNANGR